MTSSIHLGCHDCKYEWDKEFPLPMPVKQFVMETRTTICPKCGRDRIFIIQGGKTDKETRIQEQEKLKGEYNERRTH